MDCNVNKTGMFHGYRKEQAKEEMCLLAVVRTLGGDS